MISLRKHIEKYQDSLTESSLAAFRAALIAIGECGGRAVPAVSADLTRNLAGIHGSLSQSVTSDSLNAATEHVHRELSQWADLAFRHHEDNEREIREIMGAVAKAAESVGDRDDRFAREIGDLAGTLRSAAEFGDIATLRRSIIESTAALKVCVEKMAEENKTSVHQLTAQVTEYRDRLEKSQLESVVDPLTKLANRRAFEQRLEEQISQRKDFCLILLDMDNFKAVNDHHGHVAGDDLLRQFGAELKAQFRPVDLVSRWGGDEFAVLAEGNLRFAEAGVDRIRKWALGEYKIATGDSTVKTKAGASIGAVQWNRRETGIELLARADKGVYLAKSAGKLQKQTV